MKQISDEPVPPRIVEPSVPRELEAVVLRVAGQAPVGALPHGRGDEPRARRGPRRDRRHRRHHPRACRPRRRGDRRAPAWPMPVTRPHARRAAAPARAPAAARRRWPLDRGRPRAAGGRGRRGRALLSGGGGHAPSRSRRSPGRSAAEAGQTAAPTRASSVSAARSPNDRRSPAGTAIDTDPAAGQRGRTRATPSSCASAAGPGDDDRARRRPASRRPPPRAQLSARGLRGEGHAARPATTSTRAS